MDNRPEIDGLRAVAVIPVICFHAGFSLFGGGFVGVDIFFVISGYLITTILLEEIVDRGSISLVRFYERRARRILPALFCVMAACTPLAWMVLFRTDLRSFSNSLVAVSLFGSNFYFWRAGTYFETGFELKPLLHTWSLAVEEQYYLIYPAFILIAWKFGKRWFWGLLFTGGIISLGAAQWAATRHPGPAFFLAPFRAWELSVGGLSAYYWQTAASNATRLTRQSLSLTGFVMVLASIFWFSEDIPFPGLYALVPVLGSALLILFATPNTLVGRVLSHRVLVGLGLISYSAYLWHQPLLALAHHWNPQRNISVVVIPSLILAGLSWRFVERPFRDKKRFSRAAIFGLSAAGSLTFILIGLGSVKSLKANRALNDESRLAMALSRHSSVYFAPGMDERMFIRCRIKYESANPSAIVTGSSRIMQIGERNLGASVLNLGVGAASLEDDIAILYLATRKFHPATLLIGADPWLFNARSGQLGWKSLEPEYRDALSVLRSVEGKRAAPAAREIHTEECGQPESYGKRDLYESVNFSRVVAEDGDQSIKDRIRHDGTHVYDSVSMQKIHATIEWRFPGLLLYSMAPYEFSERLVEDFTSLVRYYNHQSQVVLVLSPYHPGLYALMKHRPDLFEDAEARFRALAVQTGVRIVGSYDPRKAGCSESEFFDGMHPDADCMGRVVVGLR